MFPTWSVEHTYLLLLYECRSQDDLFIGTISSEQFCPNKQLSLWKPYFPCPYCEANRLGRRNTYIKHYYASSSYQNSLKQGFGGVKGSKEEFNMKRPETSTPKKGQKKSCPDADWSKKFPTIAAYMVDDLWDDGKVRKVSTLTINMDNGSVTVSLADHDLEQSAYTTFATLPEALQAMEDALKADKIAWRRWKRGK